MLPVRGRERRPVLFALGLIGLAAAISSFWAPSAVLCAVRTDGAPPSGSTLSSIDPAEPEPAVQQKRDKADETRTTEVTPPGSDATVFMPGTTVSSYGDTGFFKFGRLRMRPGARLSYLYESNLFATAGDRVSDRSFHFEPSLDALLPVGANGIRVAYVAAYRDYHRFQLREGWSHVLTGDSELALSPVFSVALRNRFVRSSLDAREYMPGREIVFSESRFLRNDAEAQLNWSLSEIHSLGVSAEWDAVRFDRPESGAKLPFYDYDEYRVGASYTRDWTRRTALFVAGDFERLTADDPRDVAASRGFEARAGITVVLSPLVTGQFSVGYRRLRFPAAPHQGFGGPVYRCDLLKEVTPDIQLSLAAFRSTNPSFFENNAYFVANGVGVNYSQAVGPNLKVSVRPGYQRNSYPLALAGSPGARRSDDILDLYLNARYRFSEWLALEVLGDYLRRRSALPEFDFTDYRIAISLILGQEPAARGRVHY